MIGQEAGSTGRILVDGVGSELLVGDKLTVGDAGRGSLDVLNGGVVGEYSTGNFMVVSIGTSFSNLPTIHGDVVVDGTGSQLIASEIIVGEQGKGSLTIANAGLVEVLDYGSMSVGNSSGATGEVVVRGAGSQLIVDEYSTFEIGRHGNGTLNILEGGFVWTKTGNLDTSVGNFDASSEATVLVDGTDSIWRSGVNTPIGLAGGITLTNSSFSAPTTLIVSNGGVVETSLLFAQFHGSSIILDKGHLAIDSLELSLSAGLFGDGTIGGDVVNDGVISPGASPGHLSVAGDYTQLAEGVLKIELEGYAPGAEYDLLEISGAATLGGILEISLLHGFAPNMGDSFEFFTAGSIEGTFSSVIFSGGTVDVTYLDSGVRLSNFHLVSVPDLPGDYNEDGVVDAADYTVWRNNLGDLDETNLNNNGDGGAVTEADYTWWKQHYGDTNLGAGGGGLTQHTVPEPCGAALLSLGCVLALVGFCRPGVSIT